MRDLEPQWGVCLPCFLGHHAFDADGEGGCARPDTCECWFAGCWDLIAPGHEPGPD